ncbi:hypothetical protein COLO4_15634 [Corchorus olitorius]|uniref:Uncharacterized protein n=1 Tax=Corchorus olitorius TaxID=93759 RepID=A0A1R3JM21_9ROSI|nr:hypothetical protein COLO4_15634 [Corchorus olitorius]
MCFLSANADVGQSKGSQNLGRANRELPATKVHSLSHFAGESLSVFEASHVPLVLLAVLIKWKCLNEFAYGSALPCAFLAVHLLKTAFVRFVIFTELCCKFDSLPLPYCSIFAC